MQLPLERASPPFELTALLLQCLGSYQAGVYQALAEADLHADWVAGISIGGRERCIKLAEAAELTEASDSRLCSFAPSSWMLPFAEPNAYSCTKTIWAKT